jgi:hypothetical protein
MSSKAAATTNQAELPTVATTADIEWSVVEGENTEFSVQFPRMQWVHGEKKAAGFNKTGGLFISSEQYPNFHAEGFSPETFISRKDEIPGTAAQSAKLAVIRVKHQWVKDEGRNVPLVHALVVAKGCEDIICLSLRGASKALEFQNAFNQHMAHNVSLANRTRPQGASALEPFALWFPITAGEIETITSKDGKNESNVTRPELFQPETLDRNYVVSLWVGAENYKKFASYWKDTAQWQKTPIWEQRDEVTDQDLTDQTGGGKASREQLEHLIMLCEAKGFDEAEIMNGITAGRLSKFVDLTADEARQVARELAAR